MVDKFIFVGIPLVLVCLSYFGLPQVVSFFSRLVLKRKARARRMLCLTFDDGPGVLLTREIVEVLGRSGTKATFFLLGRSIHGKESLVRLLLSHGHQVCSHGYGHIHYWKNWPWQTIGDIRKGWEAIDLAIGAVGGKYPFRPPYGKINLAAMIYLMFKGVPIIYWTVDSGDSRKQLPGQQYMSAVSEALSWGGVLLLHDFERQSPQRAQYVLDVIEGCIELATNKGLFLATVSEAIN